MSNPRLDVSKIACFRTCVLAALFCTNLTACNSGHDRVPSVADNGEWSLRGRVVDESSGEPLEAHAVSLISIQNTKCFFCKETESVLVVSILTDETGSFHISSQVAGNFDVFVRSKANPACVAKESLGVMDATKELDVLLKVPDKECVLLR